MAKDAGAAQGVKTGARVAAARVLACCLVHAIGWLAAAAGLMQAFREAYAFRLHAIAAYGPVIHEFDPYFNFRAAEHLAANGWHAFFHWFDHSAWYPLGRPVGTTIYPGMQIAAVAIWRTLNEGAQLHII